MPETTIRIGPRTVGPGHRPYLIAEVAQAHDGSLGTAHAFVDVVADAGFDAVKFQTHIAAEESTLDEPFRVKFSRQDDTRYAYWKRMEFPPEAWQGLAEHARERGIDFLSTPFSETAIEWLQALDVPAWKVGSGETTTAALLTAMAATGKPVLLSTGMSRYDEIEASVRLLEDHGAPVALFQCTSKYPVALEEVGLNVLDQLRDRFGRPVGLSDHSGTLHPGLAALATGADLLEVHVTLSRRAFGPDVPASLTPDELADLAAARDAFHTMRTHPVDKDATAEALAPMRALFRKSVAPATDLPAGTVLSADHLTLRKPGDGIPEADLPALVGRRLARDVSPDRLLREEDLDA